MRATLAAVTLVLLSPLARAGEMSVVIATGYGAVPAARIQTPAEYVALPVSIQSDAKDPVKRAEDVQNAMEAIAKNLGPGLSLRPGAVSLSIQEATGSKSYFDAGSFSKPAYAPGSSAQVYILGALKPGASVYDATKRIHEALKAVSFGESTRVSLGTTSLGMDDPEKYRGQILAAMAKSIGEIKKALGPGSVEVTGLENPVSVVQLNERDVLLFINYRLSVQTK